MWVGDWINNFAGDEGVNFEGELHVGSYVQPSESTFGGGDSHVLGLAALTNTNLEAGAWNDISVEIASGSGSTVDVVAGVAAANCFYVGGDTGPTHIAAAVGVPTVALFGAADPLRNRPLGPRAEALSAELDCSPCWLRSGCPRGHECMSRIAPGRVLEACQRILASAAEGRVP